MASGILLKRFPEMKWKNTVNQCVSNTQQVIDYLELGYNIIQIDRSLNRNLDELKKIRYAVDKYKDENPEKDVKLCMLISEACLPFCPFKREHDDMQIYHRDFNYWNNIGVLSCNNWRFSSMESCLEQLLIAYG